VADPRVRGRGRASRSIGSRQPCDLRACVARVRRYAIIVDTGAPAPERRGRANGAIGARRERVRLTGLCLRIAVGTQWGAVLLLLDPRLSGRRTAERLSNRQIIRWLKR
jgi:hypothetical protein